jgi:hypothetical protein
MKNTKNLIKWIIGVIAILFFLSADFTPGTKTAIVIGVFLYLIISEQNKRFRRVENAVGLLDNPTPQDEAFKTPSYKLDIILEPNWHEIITKLAKDNKTDAEKFIDEIKKDKKLNIEEGKGLFGKLFRFVYFYDGVSHLEQIWSDHYKTFVDEIEIRGNIFESENMFSWIGNKKYENSNIANTLVMTPGFIGFHTILPDGDVMDDEKLSIFPFGEINKFFINLHKNIGLWGPMYKIKKFPQNLAQEFEKNKIKYEDWDYEDYGCGVDAKEDLIDSEWAKKNNIEICDQKMRSQIFTSPFYTIRLKMEIFD